LLGDQPRRRHEERLKAHLLRRVGHGQDAVDVAHGAEERELADEERAVEVGRQLAAEGEQRSGNRQPVGRAFLAQVGRGQPAPVGVSQGLTVRLPQRQDDPALTMAARPQHLQ